MKKIIIVVVAFAFFISCKTKLDESFYEILNENLVEFIELNSYNSGKFVLVPDSESVKLKIRKNYSNILLDTIIPDSKVLANSIFPNLKKENLEAFEYLIKKNLEDKNSKLNIKKIIRRGEYKLFSSGDRENIDTSFKGQIIFPRPYISTDKAIIFFSVKVSAKAGRTIAYFLTRNDKNWHILKSLEVERL